MTQFRGIDPITDNWLVTKVKQNPEAFLVLAAGCALLLRAGGSASRATSDYRTGGWNNESRLDAIRDRTTAAASNVAADLQDRVKDTATAVSQKASDYAATLSDRAGAISERATGYVASLSHQASDWGRGVADERGRMGARARSSMQDGLGRMVKEQPLRRGRRRLRRRCRSRSLPPADASGARRASPPRMQRRRASTRSKVRHRRLENNSKAPLNGEA
jgi:hypothetical protein